MKYAFILATLGLGQIVFAHIAGAFGWLFWWSGLSWIFAGCAYGFIGAKAFGKRINGSMSWWNVLVAFPYLAVTWLLWHIQKAITREPQCSQVAPGVWLGRRCFASELPEGIEVVVDLTAEFSEPKQVTEGRTYFCLPILDASVPSLEDFRELVQKAVDVGKPTYFHCALGHGRSATVVAAVLIARGNALSINQAELMIRMVRPRIAINSVQHNLLRQWHTAI